MCSLNQLYLTAELHAHSTPKSQNWPGTSDEGPQVRELASEPLAQVSPLRGVELTPSSWGAPDRQGPTKQLVTITNGDFEQ